MIDEKGNDGLPHVEVPKINLFKRERSAKVAAYVGTLTMAIVDLLPESTIAWKTPRHGLLELNVRVVLERNSYAMAWSVLESEIEGNVFLPVRVADRIFFEFKSLVQRETNGG